MIGAIIKTVITIIGAVIKLVNGILKAFHLRFLAVVVLCGGILFMTGVLPENHDTMIVFYVFLAIGVLYTLIVNYKNVSSDGKKKEKKESKKTEKKIKEEKEDTVEEEKKPKTVEPIERDDSFKKNNVDGYPRFYNVRQNNNYVMAEYKDRYELFLKREGKLIKIRTDYKRDIK